MRTELSREEDHGFADRLKASVAGLAQLQTGAASAAEAAALGDLSQLHEAVIATQKAGLALEFAVAVRNQAVEGLQELLHTQV
jgi:flagellar hook-basal body complex protein FliE